MTATSGANAGTTQPFNPATYKKTTREQWDSAAYAWDSWGPTIEEWLDEATSAMFDISPVILERAQHRLERAGLTNAATRVMDGENLAVEPSSFDAVISRLGIIYLPDRAAALAQFEDTSGFIGPCTLLVAAGTR